MLNSDMNINCLHFDLCSGCAINEHVNNIDAYVEARQFFASHGFSELKLQVGAECHWRCRAKLAVRGTVNDPKIGLFSEGTHQVVDIPFCKVHHSSINKAVAAVRQWIVQCSILPYDERSGKGCLRYIQAVVERSTWRVQLTFVVNFDSIDRSSVEEFNKKILILLEMYPDLWHSIWINSNTRRDNVIFGNEWHLLHGDMWLWETLKGAQVCFHPGSFAQANLEMFERLVDCVSSWIPSGASLLEYYAGVGTIGLMLAPECIKVQCVESVPLAKNCFEESLKKMAPELSQRLNYISAVAEKSLYLLDNKANVVVVDPPRKGLTVPMRQALCKAALHHLIYISCGWESFQRDALELLAAGWHIENAEAFLFFPGSNHIELAVHFLH